MGMGTQLVYRFMLYYNNLISIALPEVTADAYGEVMFARILTLENHFLFAMDLKKKNIFVKFEGEKLHTVSVYIECHS